MRIAVVGPTHPIKGGVAQHTTALAKRLSGGGHDVRIVSWLRQYPHRLYPGTQTVEDPESEPFAPTQRALSWNRPDSWVQAGWGLRRVDHAIFAHITPVQVLPYRSMIAALHGSPTATTVICHNVLPHERSTADRRLVRMLLGSANRVIVHSEPEAEVARALTRRPIVVAPLAPFMPDSFVPTTPLPGEHRRLVFFGIVRPYKGLDVLLRALARGPSGVQLRVAGEFWSGTEETERLCRDLGISDRVELRSGYVPAAEVPSLFEDADALVLPYRSATGSQAVWTGFQFGLPVIATSAGRLANDIRAGVDGLVVEPDDVDALAAALWRFYLPGEPERMRSQVAVVDPRPEWDRYVAAVLGPGQVDPASRSQRQA